MKVQKGTDIYIGIIMRDCRNVWYRGAFPFLRTYAFLWLASRGYEGFPPGYDKIMAQRAAIIIFNDYKHLVRNGVRRFDAMIMVMVP